MNADTTLDDPIPTPRRRAKFYARLALALVILIALFFAGRKYYGELDRLKSAPPGIVAIIAGLYVLGRLPPAEVLRAALAALGHQIGRVETFFALMVQYYVNMLIPRAGIGALAGYLKLRGVPVGDLGAAQLVLLTLAQFACLGLAALACQVGLAVTHRAKFDPILGAVFAAVTVVSVALLVLPIPSLLKNLDDGESAHFLSRFAARLAGACRLLGRDHSLLARAVLAHLIVLPLRALRLQLCFRAVGQHVDFWPVFVASCAADVMFLISITPGALGFREGGLVYTAGLLGTTGSVAMAAALLDRIVLTGCNIVLGQIGLWRYVGRR